MNQELDCLFGNYFLIGDYTIRLFHYLKQITTMPHISRNEQIHHINKEWDEVTIIMYIQELQDIVYQLSPRLLLNTLTDCFSLIWVIMYFRKEEFLEAEFGQCKYEFLSNKCGLNIVYIINKLESFKCKSSI